MDRDNIFQLATSNPEITEDQRLETPPRQSWWLRPPTQARRHHATVDPVLVHDRRPHRRSKYWGGKFSVLTSTFIVIIFLSKKRNFLRTCCRAWWDVLRRRTRLCTRSSTITRTPPASGWRCSLLTPCHIVIVKMPSNIGMYSNVQCPACHSKSSASFTCSSCQVEVIPIKNEADLVVLFLCNYRDITAFKVTGNLIFLQSFWSREIISYIPHSSESLLQTY